MSPTLYPALTDSSQTAQEAAFCKPVGSEVFSGIIYGNQIWSADPFDVETIHPEPRQMFDELLTRAASPDLPPSGKTMLLLGEAGSGKTHLMRAFRTVAHSSGLGYCGYLQMRTSAHNYAQYLLSNLISSLEQPYKTGHPETGLHRLAQGLLDALDMIPAHHRQQLTDDMLEPEELARLVHRCADMAVQYPQFHGININVLRAILYTLPTNGRIRPRVLNWLRCEDLNRYDRELIGDLIPRTEPDKPHETILELGRLMHAVQSSALVLLVDQIDQALELDQEADNHGKQFRNAISVLLGIADQLPNALIVIGCLEDLFTVGRNHLPSWTLDRLEHNPEPMRLRGKPTLNQIKQIVGKHLEVFYDSVDVSVDPGYPIAPFTDADFIPLEGMHTRTIMDECLQHRRKCIAAGKTIAFDPRPDPIMGPKPASDWETRWNDFLSAYKSPIIDEESKLAELLAFAFRTISLEMPNGIYFEPEVDDRFVALEIHTHGNTVDKVYVAVCNKNAQGGGLGKQVNEVINKVGEIPTIFVRSTPFPATPTAAVTKQMVGLIHPRGKGRKVVVANSDWRAMVAFRDFYGKHHAEPGFAEWQKSERPLSEIPAVHTILNLEKLLLVSALPLPPVLPPLPPAGLAKVEVKTKEVNIPSPQSYDPLYLGTTRGNNPTPITLTSNNLCRHAAFLGGSGSGKTTAALTLIEQLLLCGVPCILLDRKGDLSRYADPEAWAEPETNPARAERRERLQQAVDVALYTPGSDAGRPLGIPIAPSDLASESSSEREQHAQFAANSLGLMLGYRGRNPDPKLVILQKAIEAIAQVPGCAVTVRSLYDLVDKQDDDLLSLLSGYEDKHFKKLAQDLLTLSLQHRRLFESDEMLDIDRLLGRGIALSGRTRLSIINTQFLGDAGTTDFWVAQFLLAVDRWRAKNPAPQGVLQAVFLFDEADQYLPAVGKPATKGPMESVLKRARSAGIGIFLATQSPGDLDYKCRDQIVTWLIGRVKEAVAINKLKPMLERSRIEASAKLADQQTGEFFLVREEDVVGIRVHRNLISTAQLPEDRILALAKGRRPHTV